MVIDMLVYIESLECVEGLLICESFWHEFLSKDGNKMGSTDDGVEVDDRRHRISSVIDFGLQNPQTGVVVWPFS